MNLIWEDEAKFDLRAIRTYIRRDNPSAASKTAAKIAQAVEVLRAHPAMGRAGRAPHTREMVVTGTPYLVIYSVSDRSIVILRVLHGAMQWPA